MRRGIAAVVVFVALLLALVVGLSATVLSAVSEWLGSAVMRVEGGPRPENVLRWAASRTGDMSDHGDREPDRPGSAPS